MAPLASSEVLDDDSSGGPRGRGFTQPASGTSSRAGAVLQHLREQVSIVTHFFDRVLPLRRNSGYVTQSHEEFPRRVLVKS
ncbi:unnamed protein product [Strongylus vulgaris]|uniref:Uncharacterized protein n=1 Tax=Strongylus vulgaris TaxID=40348 RepID=A0A3P7IP85_STRVU|nr:unnamed protein product [Strongylus vulgaris]